jgi:hypothetical protein
LVQPARLADRGAKHELEELILGEASRECGRDIAVCHLKRALGDFIQQWASGSGRSLPSKPFARRSGGAMPPLLEEGVRPQLPIG